MVNSCDIVCISKPHAHADTITGFPKSQFSLLSCQEPSRTGLLVRSQYDSLCLDRSRDVTAVMIQVSPTNSIMIIHVYCYPSEPIEPMLRALTRVLENSGGRGCRDYGRLQFQVTPLWCRHTTFLERTSQRLDCVPQPHFGKQT